MQDELEIVLAVQRWAVARDTGDWDTLRQVFHPEGRMTATWFSGTAASFIAQAAESFAKGGRSAHVMGGTLVRLNGGKAVAQSRMTLLSRAVVEGVEVDVTCHGGFHDRFVRHEGRWRLLQRNCFYEKDRMDPVKAGTAPLLDPALLERYPEGYRHLAYVQTRAGMTVEPQMPTLRSAALETLYKEGKAWLESD
jgi:hypothetical protein